MATNHNEAGVQSDRGCANAANIASVNEADVFNERLRTFAHQSRSALLIHPVLAIILALVIWHDRSPILVGGWIATIMLVSLVRVAHIRWYLNHGDIADDRTVARIFIVGALVSGALWGLSAVIFLADASPIHREFQVIFLFGLAAGSALVGSAFLPIAVTFNTAVLAPVAFVYLVDVELHHQIMAAIVVLFIGLLSRVAKTSQDTIITAIRRRMENERLVTSLTAAVDEAERARKSQADFLANISHEIRTPMNGIMGTLTLARTEPDMTKRRAHINTAQQSAKSLLNIINDLLDLSHIEAGKFRITEVPFDFQALVEECVKLVEPDIQNKGLTLSVSINGNDDRQLISDPDRLRQVLLNLLGNAVKFTDVGKISLEATFSADGPEPRLAVSIIDTGCGISEEFYPRLFGRFQQGDSSYARQHQGSGLGLAICREIIEALGGQIGVDSKPGEGSRFWFDVPVKVDGSASVDRRAMEQRPVLEDLQILVVEDNEINQQVVEAFLEQLGHKYRTADSGETALALLDQALLEGDDYSLILMDVQMPGMDGIEATKQIRARHDKFATIPIVALTAHAMSQHRAKYLAAGMNGYVAKPIELGSLDAEIRRVLGRIPDTGDDYTEEEACRSAG